MLDSCPTATITVAAAAAATAKHRTRTEGSASVAYRFNFSGVENCRRDCCFSIVSPLKIWWYLRSGRSAEKPSVCGLHTDGCRYVSFKICKKQRNLGSFEERCTIESCEVLVLRNIYLGGMFG